MPSDGPQLNMHLMNPQPLPAALSEQPSPAATDGHRALLDRHLAVLNRIAEAALACGRKPDAINLLAVSKTFDADAVLTLATHGQRRFAESYLQEALAKMATCHDQWATPPSGRSGADRLEWHFIGPIQSNKTRPIAEHFDWVESIEREKIAQRLSEQRPSQLAPLQVCIQVNVSGEASKSGCSPDEAIALARAVSVMPRLQLRGVMAIPAPSDDLVLQRKQFAAVREIFEKIRAEGIALDTLSMGMSSDLEAAVCEGATLVRVGSALFGARAPG
jgi:pyridoxal phosphate enzyme (YggS family)